MPGLSEGHLKRIQAHKFISYTGEEEKRPGLAQALNTY